MRPILRLSVTIAGVSLMILVVMLGARRSSSMSGEKSAADFHLGSLSSSTDFLNICTHNPNLCPVDQATWPGEPGAWQRTAKRWQRVINSPPSYEVVWYGSGPYSGTNHAYIGHREVYYADYTHTPDLYPAVTGTAPAIFEWQAWQPITGNYLLRQYGGATEEIGHPIGVGDCESGIHYPVVDHTAPYSYSYTPLSIKREGICVGGGYIGAYLVELWGEPLSAERIRKCDSGSFGIPASQSPRASQICKGSPYVGMVNQIYVWGAGPTASDSPVVGCETVVYVWGWSQPTTVTSGQSYESLFRNGELRYSKWINLSNQISGGVIPVPSDRTWWNTQCARAQSTLPSWLYSGVYKIGSTIYTDTIGPFSASTIISTEGGSLVSPFDNTEYVFPQGTFTGTVSVTHTFLSASEISSTGLLRNVNRSYRIAATYVESGVPAKMMPGKTYTVTIHYTGGDKSAAVEPSLKLYYWGGNHWSTQGTSCELDQDQNIMTCRADRFDVFSVLGSTILTYLPVTFH